MDNPKINKVKNQDDYPNLVVQKQLYNDAMNIFQEIAAQEVNDDVRQNMSEELIKLTHNDNSVQKLINLLYNLKSKSGIDKQAKIICSLNQKDKSDVDPLVDLEIEGYQV